MQKFSYGKPMTSYEIWLSSQEVHQLVAVLNQQVVSYTTLHHYLHHLHLCQILQVKLLMLFQVLHFTQVEPPNHQVTDLKLILVLRLRLAWQQVLQHRCWVLMAWKECRQVLLLLSEVSQMLQHLPLMQQVLHHL